MGGIEQLPGFIRSCRSRTGPMMRLYPCRKRSGDPSSGVCTRSRKGPSSHEKNWPTKWTSWRVFSWVTAPKKKGPSTKSCFIASFAQ